MVKLGKKNAIWGFFWSEGGLEYRFRTNPMKEIRRPAHHLLLKHGDELHHNPNQDVFTCRYNAEIVVTWVAAQTYGSNLSPNIFERVENPETLALSLVYVSGSGFGLSFDGRVEVDDLVRIQGGDKLPSFLEDQIGRVVRATTDALECRFLTMDAEKHHLLLTYIASKMTVDDFQKRLKARRVAKRTQK